VKKQHDLEENIFGFVDISHRRYKLRRDVKQTPSGARPSAHQTIHTGGDMLSHIASVRLEHVAGDV
jgi:hypothetical protein